MQMINKEKKAIEYLKVRLYGNEGCKFIDVSQSDLRIFLNLIDKQENRIKELEEINEEHQKINGNIQKRITDLENILKGKSIHELGISELYNDNHIPHID